MTRPAELRMVAPNLAGRGVAAGAGIAILCWLLLVALVWALGS